MNPAHSRQFASDTYAGLCPQALATLLEANVGHVSSYGDDPWTARATQRLCELFETECVVYFVSTGTAANALALAALCRPYHSVLCHATAHIQTDECGAPEFLCPGIKLVAIEGREAKLDPATVRHYAALGRGVHSHKPAVLSLSQATEAGTLYSVAELQTLGATARELGLRVHLDGARLANAVAALGVPPRALTWEAGVDVLAFGGTKNGLASGDAIVFFDRGLATDFGHRRKQAGHLSAKMRFLSAPWVGLLESGAWLSNAQNANAMARRLAEGLSTLTGIRLVYPTQANAVFVDMPEAWSAALRQRGWLFYAVAGGERLMCAWDTTASDVDALVADLRVIAGGRNEA